MFFPKAIETKLKKIVLASFLFILFTFSFQLNVLASKTIHYEKNWIDNSDFSLSEDHWFSTIQGDTSDVNTTFHSEQANFEVLGDKMTFSLVADPPLASNWTEVDNPSFPNRPDVDEITSAGCRVSHEFNDQSAIQNPSVHWDNNITLPVNMSDYIITRASIQARVNATADENVDRFWDYYYGRNARVDPSEPVDQYGNGDYARFYVLLSDLGKNKVYEIAYLQTVWLGNGGAPGTDYLYDTYMLNVPQEDLIYFLDLKAPIGVPLDKFPERYTSKSLVDVYKRRVGWSDDAVFALLCEYADSMELLQSMMGFFQDVVDAHGADWENPELEDEYYDNNWE